MEKQRTYILWPKQTGRDPEEAGNPVLTNEGFSADQIPETLKLGARKDISFKGPKSLKRRAGATIKVAMVEGKRGYLWDTGLGIVPSEVMDMDTTFGPQEAEYMRRLRHLMGVPSKVKDAITSLLSPHDGSQPLIEEVGPLVRFNGTTLERIGEALSNGSPSTVLEAVTALDDNESAVLFLTMTAERDQLSRGIPLSTEFQDKMHDTLLNNMNPYHPWRLQKGVFVLSPEEIGERFEAIRLRPGRDDKTAAEAANDVLEHYAIVGRFVEPSKDEHFDQVIMGLRHANPDVRSCLAHALVYIKPLRAYPHLLPLLRDENKTVRKAAVMAFGELRDERAVDHIRDFIEDPDPEVREIAVSSLVSIGGDEAQTLLKARRSHEDDPTIREDIRRGLRELEHRGFNDQKRRRPGNSVD